MCLYPLFWQSLTSSNIIRHSRIFFKGDHLAIGPRSDMIAPPPSRIETFQVFTFRYCTFIDLYLTHVEDTPLSNRFPVYLSYSKWRNMHAVDNNCCLNKRPRRVGAIAPRRVGAVDEKERLYMLSFLRFFSFTSLSFCFFFFLFSSSGGQGGGYVAYACSPVDPPLLVCYYIIIYAISIDTYMCNVGYKAHQMPLFLFKMHQ